LKVVQRLVFELCVRPADQVSAVINEGAGKCVFVGVAANIRGGVPLSNREHYAPSDGHRVSYSILINEEWYIDPTRCGQRDEREIMDLAERI